VPLPILRKDFIIDSYQDYRSKSFRRRRSTAHCGGIGTGNSWCDLHDEANELGLDCLVEVHNERELTALDLKQVKIVGINNRNLSDFTIDVTTTLRVASIIPKISRLSAKAAFQTEPILIT